MAIEPLGVSREPNQTEVTVRRYKSWGVWPEACESIPPTGPPSVPPGIVSGRKPPSPCTSGFSAISDLAKPPTFKRHTLYALAPVRRTSSIARK